MIGTIYAEFDRAYYDDDGMLVSFRIPKGYCFVAKQTLAVIKQDVEKGKPGLELKIDHPKKKRTNTANSYFWALCSRVAEKLETTADELYRKYIREVGVSDVIAMVPEAVDKMKQAWALHGTGWFVEVLDMGSDLRMATVKVYYGSSTYDGRQMARLIDRVKEDCAELGITTIAEDEINELLKRWVSEE